ncbi:MAG: class I SAM-dependent methyltransferase [Candidatus Binatia bacterium]
MRTLSHEDARRVYDKIGSFQDRQAFYEDRTTAELVAHGRFAAASRVFEFGCGTGRFAESLLTEHLPEAATYRGIDLSPTMVGLAHARLDRFGPRAAVVLSDGGPPDSEPTASCDRWISNFVLDLLSEKAIEEVLAEAHRMLVPGGLLCLAGLSTGSTRSSRMAARAWSAIHGWSPELVGGCRPIDVTPYLAPERWLVRHHARLAPFCIPSEAVVAERRH